MGVFYWHMDTQTFQTQETVEEILKAWPQAIDVFRKHGTHCIGCFLQRFCTLKDVAETYSVELSTLLHDLEATVKTNNNSQRSI